MNRILLLFTSVLLLALSCQKFEPVISIDGRSEYKLSPSSTMLIVKLNTNCDTWEYDCGGADWLTELKRESNSLTLSVADNTTTETRTASITFYAPAKGASAAVAVVSVEQAGETPEPSITVESACEVPAAGGTLDIPVSTNQGSWEAEIVEGEAWCPEFAVRPEGISVTIAVNEVEEPRTIRLRVFAPSKASATVYSDVVIRQAAAVIVYEPENLSAEGSSNCYLVSHRGVYYFDATVRGNGATTKGLASPSKLEPAGARLIWQTAKGMVKSVSYADGVITFELSKTNGSAVIAATSADGTVIWSWHIWFPVAEIEELRCETGDVMMNLNLGARDNEHSNISSHGMMYQWGRKDPFPHSPVAHEGSVFTLNIPVYDMAGNQVKIGQTNMYDSKNNYLAYSIAHPDVCISNNNQFSTCRDWLLPAESNSALWGNPDGNERTNGKYTKTGSKSFYDPCPVGWRVAPIRAYYYMTESGGYTWASGDTVDGIAFYDLGGSAEVAVADVDGDGKYTLSDWQDGWDLYLDRKAGVLSYFPAAARYDGQYAMLMGSMVGLWANYWTNTASTGTDGLAVALSFSLTDYNKNYSITISPVSSGSRADGYSVRCIKE